MEFSFPEHSDYFGDLSRRCYCPRVSQDIRTRCRRDANSAAAPTMTFATTTGFDAIRIPKISHSRSFVAKTMEPDKFAENDSRVVEAQGLVKVACQYILLRHIHPSDSCGSLSPARGASCIRSECQTMSATISRTRTSATMLVAMYRSPTHR